MSASLRFTLKAAFITEMGRKFWIIFWILVDRAAKKLYQFGINYHHIFIQLKVKCLSTK